MKRISFPFFLLVFVFPLALALQGCIVVGPSGGGVGDLIVDWSFAGDQACPSDVDDVVIRIEGRDEVKVDCANGKAEITGLAAGVYRVVVVGIDSAGGATWQSSPADLDVRPDRDNPYGVDLQDI